MKHIYINRKRKKVELEYIGDYTIFTNDDGTFDIRKKFKNFYKNKNKRKYIYIPVNENEKESILKQVK